MYDRINTEEADGRLHGTGEVLSNMEDGSGAARLPDAPADTENGSLLKLVGCMCSRRVNVFR